MRSTKDCLDHVQVSFERDAGEDHPDTVCTARMMLHSGSSMLLECAAENRLEDSSAYAGRRSDVMVCVSGRECGLVYVARSPPRASARLTRR